MSEKTFVLTVVTPESRVFQDSVNMVIVRTTEGDIGVLAGHTPLVAPLEIAPMTIKIGDNERKAAVNGGFVEVTPDHMTILAESAEMAEQIDVDRAEAARSRAEERLAQHQGDVDFARAQAALQRALVRLQVAGRDQG
ncbi:MAG: F0F1 ATP synthase subunit epsilon [Firmicutes bacterium]|nr:F0F1 ATP synthase subunit epsilon [Bacillota bacterium]